MERKRQSPSVAPRRSGSKLACPTFAAALFVVFGCDAPSRPPAAPDSPPPSSPQAQPAPDPGEMQGGEAAPPPAEGSQTAPPPAAEASAGPNVAPPAAGAGAVPPGPSATVSEAEVEQFATVQVELTTLEQKFQQEAQTGASQEQLQSLEAQLQQEAAQIIEQSDLSRERLDEIIALSQGDANLQQRLVTAIQEKANGAP